MKKVLAALAGAVLADLMIVVGVAVLYHPPTHDNWDMGTPMITLAALLPAALFGGAVGFVLVDLVKAKQVKAARWVGGGGALLVAMIPVGIVLLPYLPVPSRPPTPAEERATWAQWVRQAHAGLGEQLADELRRCLGENGVPSSGEDLLRNGCESARRRWLALGPEQLAKLGSYAKNADDGWRWDIVESAGQRRLMVFPDPLLAGTGPTFEVRADETVRNDPPRPPEPPRFNRDSTLPRLGRFRECVRARAAELRRAGAWTGLGESLPPLLQSSAPDSTGCPAVGISAAAEGPLRPWSLQVRDGAEYPLQVEYRAVFDGSVDTPFELSLFVARDGYMIDRHGMWHARAAERPNSVDPPPDPCLLDLSVPCR